jgi:hypothetical protein
LDALSSRGRWLAHRVLRVSLASAFLSTGASKATLLQSGPLQTALPPAVLLAVGIVECVVGIALLLSPRSRLPLWAAWGTAVALSVATSIMLMRGMDVTACGCFGRLRISAGVHTAVAFGSVLLASAALWLHAPPGSSARATAGDGRQEAHAQ